MNNSWLKFLIIKQRLLVPSMGEVNLLRRHKVPIYHLKKHPDGYLVTVRKGSEHVLGDAFEYAGTQSIYPFIIRFCLPILAVFFLVSILMQDHTIGYRVEGNLNPREEQELASLLSPHFNPIGPFNLLETSLEDIEASLREHFSEFTHIDVYRRGMNVVVAIFEAPLPGNDRDDPMSSVLTARRTGEIRKIEAESCRVVVEVGQVVKVGDHLVECSVLSPDGSMEVIWHDGVASGKVWAHTQYEATIEFPREFVTQMLTTRTQRQFILNVGNYTMTFPASELEFEVFETSVRRFDPFFFLNRSPLFLERIQYYEKSDIIRVNDVEGIQRNVEALIRNEFISGSPDGFEIAEVLLISETDKGEQGIKLKYLVTILENIAH